MPRLSAKPSNARLGWKKSPKMSPHDVADLEKFFCLPHDVAGLEKIFLPSPRRGGPGKKFFAFPTTWRTWKKNFLPSSRRGELGKNFFAFPTFRVKEKVGTSRQRPFI